MFGRKFSAISVAATDIFFCFSSGKK